MAVKKGPLWKNLRGKGLAYNSCIFCEPSDGLIYFKISKSVDVFNGYKTAMEVFVRFFRYRIRLWMELKL